MSHQIKLRTVVNTHVSARRQFKDWRDAFLFYAIAVAGNDQEVCYRPKFDFGTERSFKGLCLSLARSGEYFVTVDREFHQDDDAVRAVAFDPHAADVATVDQDYNDVLVVNGVQNELEWALIRFARDKQIRALVVDIPYDPSSGLWNDAQLVFVKTGKKQRTLQIGGRNLPTQAEFDERMFGRRA